MPVVYASDEFFRLTGYSKEEVLGKNCRLLQGPSTSRQQVGCVYCGMLLQESQLNFACALRS